MAIMVQRQINPRDPREPIFPMFPGHLGMVLKKAFGDFRVSYIKDEGQLCHTEEGVWAIVGMRPESANVLERNRRDFDKHFSYGWSKANRPPYARGLLLAHHLEKSNAIAQRLRSGDLLVGPNGVVGPRDRDGAGDQGRKRRRPPSVPPPCTSCRSEDDYTLRRGGADTPPQRRNRIRVANDTLPNPRGANGTINATIGGTLTAAP